MTKRILVVTLLATMLALAKPAPAAAHVAFSVSVGLPFVGAVVGVPGSIYSVPAYPVPVYAPPVYPAPVFVPAPVYRPHVVYVQRRVLVPAPVYYRTRVVGHHFRHW